LPPKGCNADAKHAAKNGSFFARFAFLFCVLFSYSLRLRIDLSLNYQINRILQVTVGANNLFDVYPDPLKVIQYPTAASPTSVDNSSFGRFVYSRNVTQFGFNGGYYFISLSARL
jgi:iron complex outermembrane receptor protein